MKYRSSRLVPFLALLLCACAAHAQDAPAAGPKKARTPDDYVPRTLKEVAEKGDDAGSRGNKEETMVVHGDVLPSRARVTYAGRSRPFQHTKREVLRQWARLYAGFPEGYTGPYESEVLFTEGGAEYWLAVRKESLGRLGRESKKGREVDLFLIRVGAARVSDAWEPVLLVESFGEPD